MKRESKKDRKSSQENIKKRKKIEIEHRLITVSDMKVWKERKSERKKERVKERKINENPIIERSKLILPLVMSYAEREV